MAWWSLFRRETRTPKLGDRHRVAAVLYSEDGKRQVEILEFRGRGTYMLESERGDGGEFEERHEGRLVGPFASSAAAEKFIITTPWFTGNEPKA